LESDLANYMTGDTQNNDMFNFEPPVCDFNANFSLLPLEDLGHPMMPSVGQSWPEMDDSRVSKK
jgi:hypothetical protein